MCRKQLLPQAGQHRKRFPGAKTASLHPRQMYRVFYEKNLYIFRKINPWVDYFVFILYLREKLMAMKFERLTDNVRFCFI